MIIAVLMAGGKGKRMNTNIEKPLFKFFDKSLIDHVLDNLKESKYVDKIFIALSPHTPETKKYISKKYSNNKNYSNKNYSNKKYSNKNCSNKNYSNKNYNNDSYNQNNQDKSNTSSKEFFNYLETPGSGYVEDLSFILSYFEKKSSDDILLFINADLPFVSKSIIDYVLEEYMENDVDAMSVFVPVSIFDDYGIKTSLIFDDLVPSGLNILLSRNKVQNEEKLIIPKIELALNINSVDDAELAYLLFENNQIDVI